MDILILGASYGSLFSTKLLMSGHNVCLVCRSATADLINAEGTIVELRVRGSDSPTLYSSTDLRGTLSASIPSLVDPAHYDLIVLAMQEPQYSASSLRSLLSRIAMSSKPCLSLMNMPPPPYLSRFSIFDSLDFSACYDNLSIWSEFDPDVMSLCSPDPQAFRPADKPANFLRVGLSTNFKTAPFARPEHNAILSRLSHDIDAISTDIPVKLRMSDSLFVPFAKWSMLMCGNYRCVLRDGIRSISDSVHTDLDISRKIYDSVVSLILHLGGDESHIVPFDKYATAARSLNRPSSVARSIDSGSTQIERVDLLLHTISHSLSFSSPPDFSWLSDIVDTVNHRLAINVSA